MSATAGGMGELQAFLNAHPRRLYRQGAGSIPIKAIRANPKPTRSESEPALLDELVASIKATGIIQPLIVRPVPGFPHQFEVVAGERRLKAAQLAGLTDIPAIIRDFNDHEALAISLIENIQREELSPADEARALLRLTEEFALTHEQIAHAIGRSRAAVSNLLRLLDLPAEVTTMLETRTISMGHARALLGIPDDAERVRAVMAIAVEGERSGAVLRALRGFPEVRAVHMTNGRWDMIAELETDSLEGFSNALDGVRLIEGIAATETSLLLKTHRM